MIPGGLEQLRRHEEDAVVDEAAGRPDEPERERRTSEVGTQQITQTTPKVRSKADYIIPLGLLRNIIFTSISHLDAE